MRTLLQRFNEKWRLDEQTGCWLWTAAVSNDGYGRIMVGRRKSSASRLAWELYRGPIPTKKQVLHKCDNPPCVNPDHLFLGTIADNIADCRAKGRRKGRQLGACKLSPQAVNEIRASNELNRILAARYGVSQPTISNIKTRRTYR